MRQLVGMMKSHFLLVRQNYFFILVEHFVLLLLRRLPLFLVLDRGASTLLLLLLTLTPSQPRHSCLNNWYWWEGKKILVGVVLGLFYRQAGSRGEYNVA